MNSETSVSGFMRKAEPSSGTAARQPSPTVLAELIGAEKIKTFRFGLA
jgi:hypothetical protein